MNDFDTTQPDPNEKPAAFCQNCGKPLTQETLRAVGQSVYCEPCLDAKVNGARTASAGYTPVNAGPSFSGQAHNWSGWSNPAGTTGVPNPGLAFLLGLIPGVGAMYNEQYAKGLVHLTVFAFLVVLAHASGIFGLFIFGWVIYMAIEAHHTAQAKRDGQPLPNPFGLNDIGERMGFGPGWTSPQNVANAARDAAQAAGFRPSPVATPTDPVQPVAPPPQPGTWGAPVDAYANPYGAVPPTAPPAIPPYAAPFTDQAWQAHAHQSYSQNYPPFGAPMPPYAAPFAPPFVPPVPPPPARNRFPVGAVWLIGLGALFLLGTEGIFRGLRGEALVGILFLGLGVTVFVRRMTAFGGTLEPDGGSDYQFRLLYALRPSVWLLLVGILFLLDTFNILYWDHSWPLFLILGGVMMLLSRMSIRTPYPYPPAATTTSATTTEMTRLNLDPDPPTSSSHSDTTTGGN